MSLDGPPQAPLPPGAVLPPMRALDGLQTPAQPAGAATMAKPNGPGCVSGGPSAQTVRRSAQRTPKSKHRFESINTFIDLTMRGVTARAAQIWLILWRDTKPNGLARTGVSDLAKRAGCSTSTTKRALAELRRLGLIVVITRGHEGGGPTCYRVVAQNPNIPQLHGLKSEPT